MAKDSLETLVPLTGDKDTGIIEYLHFWLIIQNDKDKKKWLKWIGCFQIEQDDNIKEEIKAYNNVKPKHILIYKGTVEKKRLFDDKPYKKYYLFDISK